MAERYCRSCGAELEPDARFCSECGEPVDGSSRRREERESRPGNGERAESDTTLAMLTHVLAIFTWVIGPAIVLLATEDEFTRENARNALNWQIMFTIYMVVSAILIVVFVGFVLLAIFPILDLIFCIVAAIKANEGEAWTYPITPDLI